MSQSIDAVENEGPGEEGLDSNLREDGKTGECGSDGSRLPVPPNKRNDQVTGTEDVKRTAEDGAGDTVEC